MSAWSRSVGSAFTAPIAAATASFAEPSAAAFCACSIDACTPSNHPLICSHIDLSSSITSVGEPKPSEHSPFGSLSAQ